MDSRSAANASFAALVNSFLAEPSQETLYRQLELIVADAKLDDSEKVVLIDGVLKGKSAKPAQVEQQIDEFKQSALKIQQGQTTWCYWKHVHSNCNTALPTLCAMCSLLRTVASQHCGLHYVIISNRKAMLTRVA